VSGLVGEGGFGWRGESSPAWLTDGAAAHGGVGGTHVC